MTVAKFEIGDRCRCLHHYAFRGKGPFTIISIATAPIEEYASKFRYVYIIRYDDATLDAIPVDDEGGYDMEKIKKKRAKE